MQPEAGNSERLGWELRETGLEAGWKLREAGN